MSRTFSRAELAFFAVPRRWIPSIVARFGDDSDVRDGIIHADDEGGLSFLHWNAKKMTWVLSDKGRRYVGPRMLAKALREWPDTRVSAGSIPACRARAIEDLFAEEEPARKPASFLCPACGAKSLGSDRCMSCESPAEP